MFAGTPLGAPGAHAVGASGRLGAPRGPGPETGPGILEHVARGRRTRGRRGLATRAGPRRAPGRHRAPAVRPRARAQK